MTRSIPADPNAFRPLTPEEAHILLHGGTEPPGTGEYLHHRAEGFYACRRCDAPLYRSSGKFDAGCGWPAFDDDIPGAVERRPDPDGRRVEIRCARCGGHLGHVFAGERLTPKNVRHCVNSLSLRFHPADAAAAVPTETAYFAAGCFWGVEHGFRQAPRVTAAVSGYMGGTTERPTYEAVCRGDTGHAETVAVSFDPMATTFRALARLFFELHDFTQVDRQGPDVGPQYRSVLFAATPEQQAVAERLKAELEAVGWPVATRIEPAGPFWPAEE